MLLYACQAVRRQVRLLRDGLLRIRRLQLEASDMLASGMAGVTRVRHARLAFLSVVGVERGDALHGITRVMESLVVKCLRREQGAFIALFLVMWDGLT